MILKIIKRIIILTLIIGAFISGCYLTLKYPNFIQNIFDRIKGIKK
jgi:Na+-transporting NADH:ubiquinone oxidoreductase subunit NqrC